MKSMLKCNRRTYITALFIMLIGLLLVPAAGCKTPVPLFEITQASTEGYQSVTVTHAVTDFSMEYPSTYTLQDDGSDKRSLLLKLTTNASGTNNHISVSFLVHKKDKIFRSYSEIPPIDYISLNNSEITSLSNRPITMFGSQGEDTTEERVYYSADGKKTIIKTTIFRSVAFDSEQCIWFIHFAYDKNEQIQREAELDHILQTLRILD